MKLEYRTDKKITSGKPHPQGAFIENEGVNFALYSQHAKSVYLLLFDTPDGEPTDIIPLENRTDNVCHVFVHGIRAGQLYGYKVEGEYDPAEGKRFNPFKLLIDPYAKAITGKFIDQDNLLFSYDVNAPKKDLIMDERDNSHIVPKSIVMDDNFDWQGDKPLHIPMNELIVYETHVKGFTAHHTSGVKYPGTYPGFIEKILYLKELGINCVELLPVQEKFSRDFLVRNGLKDYWGYNTIGFFAPESSYSTQQSPGCQVKEFKTLVRELHKARIEVILDVVYNHSGEGTELGPTLCFRGIDNPIYYRLTGKSKQPYRYYQDDTGTGNTMNIEHPQFLQLVLDSLRYWVEVMHVDGFRFDLATVLGRKNDTYQKDAVFFKALAEDTLLSKVKLIAEPWDLNTNQQGNFPKEWSEWNGKFRNTVRRFLKGEPGQIKDLGWRLTGSADLYDDTRAPYNSINFVTCHDGFTLHDLFSYNSRHNEANLSNNKDGPNESYSWNCGVEGETDDIKILELRKQMVKNALCCLFFSLGTPMLLGGDEFMRTQKGNNNAYCQDNEISWFNWDFVEKNRDILEFCRKVIAFRKKYPVLQSDTFLIGKDRNGNSVPDIAWFGNNLKPPLWDNSDQKIICFQLDGSEGSAPLQEYHLFIILNSDNKSHKIQLPQHNGMKWNRVVDTSLNNGKDFLSEEEMIPIASSDHYLSNPKSIVVCISTDTKE